MRLQQRGPPSAALACLVPGAPTAQSDLEALAAEIASAIDGDAHAALKPGDEDTPEYTAIRDQLVAFREENPEISGIYTMRNAGDITEYVVDADYGRAESAKIGDVYVPNESDVALLAGFTEPSVEPGFYLDDWGNRTATVISGYAPVKSSDGTIVGLVGVDLGILH